VDFSARLLLGRFSAFNSHLDNGQRKSTGKSSDRINSVAAKRLAELNQEITPGKCPGCESRALAIYEAASGKGNIIRIRPLGTPNLSVKNQFSEHIGYHYHDVYIEEDMIYDPLAGPEPIHKAEYFARINYGEGGFTTEILT
jgi:hypothetical protein